MISELKKIMPPLRKDLLDFSAELVRIPSYSGQEEAVIRAVEKKMKALDYDEVSIDCMGNVIGVVGHGPRKILFDSHLDTVDVADADEWTVPPFSGCIEDGFLHGRGSS